MIQWRKMALFKTQKHDTQQNMKNMYKEYR